MPNRGVKQEKPVDLAKKSTTKDGFEEFSKNAREAEIALWADGDWNLAAKPFPDWTGDEINRVMSGYIKRNLTSLAETIEKWQKISAMIQQLAEHYPKTQVNPADFKEFQFFLRAVSQEGGCNIYG